jgi:hypothetical protein
MLWSCLKRRAVQDSRAQQVTIKMQLRIQSGWTLQQGVHQPVLGVVPPPPQGPMSALLV